ncbi:glutaredoxin [Pseudomonas phage PspYZU05]|uniref:Glutaredoxin n=1 Tax=Pseudomonas phage PspYZU05 TaxID=1983556 RepID=A0A2U7NN40_9CAUD|nr:glutaredoxin [Pseudomonas phage PspYZU05]ASD52127.1 glutaredoxin [Pseudomonas phage PspYZU05]
MQIEVYGVQAPKEYCYACYRLKEILDLNDLPYTFIDCISYDSEIRYNRENIVQLASRLNKQSLAFVYPVIFLNGERINFNDFLIAVKDNGYNKHI